MTVKLGDVTDQLTGNKPWRSLRPGPSDERSASRPTVVTNLTVASPNLLTRQNECVSSPFVLATL